MMCHCFKTTFTTIIIATVKKIVLTTALLSFPLWSMNGAESTTLKNQSQQNILPDSSLNPRLLKEQTEQRDCSADLTANSKTDSTIIINDQNKNNSTPSVDDQNKNNTTTIVDDEDESQEESTAITRVKNGRFDNVRINNYLDTQNVRVEQNTYIGGDLSVTHNTTFGGNITVQGDTTINGDTTIAGDTILSGTITITGAITAAGDFNVTGTLTAENVIVNDTLTAENTIINNNLTINGSVSGGNLIHGPGIGGSTTNAIPRYADDNGISLTDSIVQIDSSGNIIGATDIGLDSISKNGNSLLWPSYIGLPGTVLGISTNPGEENQLDYLAPAAGGNVNASTNFTIDNRLLRTDTPGAPNTNIQQSLVTLSDTGNISGVVALTAATINATTGITTPTVTAPYLIGDLFGNATSTTNFSGSLAGQVTGPQDTTVVASVDGVLAADVAAGATLANTATATNTLSDYNKIVRRDSAGNFAGSTITATQFVGPLTGKVTGDLLGHASSAELAFTATYFSNSLVGDVTGSQNTTQVISIGNGALSAAAVISGATLANTATATNNPSDYNTIVRRDSVGNFAGSTITATQFVGPLVGNMTGSLTGTADYAFNFINNLVGDVTGPQTATHVALVGGKLAVDVASTVTTVQNATNTNTGSTLVLRDASGNFIANTISAYLDGSISGNAATATTAGSATTAGNFTGSLGGDVTQTQNNTKVVSINGNTMSSATIIAGVNLANQAIYTNDFNTIVRRDGLGNFAATKITADLIGSVTGNFTGPLIGNVTGDVTGQATSAVMSDTAQWFTQNLAGDVTGSQLATYVNTIQGTAASTVLAGAALANAATDNDNTPDTLVKRDALSHFTIDSITINNSPSADSDATNKAYVDSIAGGLSPKTPVLATSIVQTPTATLATLVDGVTLSANDRVLLTQQSYQVDNGIWLAQLTDWTRPLDFSIGDTAGQAFVLTTSGLTLAGSGWICSSPLSVIGTDTVTFVQYSSSGNTTAANVGTGAGQIFRDKAGLILNFKTLAGATVNTAATGNFVTVTNNANTVSLAVTATSNDTPNTLVARDGSGSFYANNINASLTGAASLNVLKTGDTMTGDLLINNTKELRLGDAGSNYIGMKAPTTVPSTYAFSLPANAPAAGQFLQALSPLATTWNTVDAPPAATKTYYVAKNGSDSNDGSLSAPFLTVKYALTQANLIASLSNPVAVQIGAGIFDENNGGGSTLEVYRDGISIVGTSLKSTIIRPLSATDNLFTVTTANIEITGLTLQAKPFATSTASAIYFTSDALGHTRLTSLDIGGFQTGVNGNSTTGIPIIHLNSNRFSDNATAIVLNNIHGLIQNSLLRGNFYSPLYTGIVTNGSLAQAAILDCFFTKFNTAVLANGGSTERIVGCSLQSIINSVITSGGSKSQVVGSNFTLNDATSVNITATGLGSMVYLEGCLFDCETGAEVSAGIAIKVVNDATLIANGCTIEEAQIGIQCGNPGDSNITKVVASGVSIIETDTCIQQQGLSTLQFTGGSVEIDRVLINNPLYVDMATFNTNGDAHLAIGPASDISSKIYELINGPGQTILPYLSYEPNYYGSSGTVYKNPQGTQTFNGTQALGNNAYSVVITSSRDKETGIRLISDTANIGTDNNVRGWTMRKMGTTADLAFTYTDNDQGTPSNERGPYTVMNLNGRDNQVEFPVATGTSPTFTTAHLVWAGDTALYRSADATLKVDNNLVINNNLTVNGLTASRAVATDANKNLASSATTNTELGYLSGVTSSVQTQISGKVAIAGDTMTGALRLPAGTTASPSLNFTGGTTAGLSSNSGDLSLSTAATERLKITAVGVISANNLTVNNLTPTAGVVHNSNTGVLSSSLILNDDIATGAAISDTKLDTIRTPGKVLDFATTATSLNIPNTIVRRDGSGNFAAGVITANTVNATTLNGTLVGGIIGSASLNVLKSGDSMTGTFTVVAGTAASPSLQFAGSTNTGISAATPNRLSFDINGVEKMSIDSTSVLLNSLLVLTKPSYNQSIQVATVTGGETITTNPAISILLLKPTGTVTITIVFPANPINGQLFTILSNNNDRINITNTAGAGGASISANTPIERLEADTTLSSNSGGASVTYIYVSADNAWYKFMRG